MKEVGGAKMISTERFFDTFSAMGMPNALRFDPPTNPGSISDIAVNWNDNIDNKGIFLSADGSPYTLKTNVKNEGNIAFGGCNIIANLSPQFSPPAVTNNATVRGTFGVTGATTLLSLIHI